MNSLVDIQNPHFKFNKIPQSIFYKKEKNPYDYAKKELQSEFSSSLRSHHMHMLTTISIALAG